MIAKPNEVYRFEYPKEPKYNCDLTVVRVTGDKSDDFVFWSDGTHSKQKDIGKLKKIK